MYISLPAIPTDATEAFAAISLVNERLKAKAKAPEGVCPMAEVAQITEYVCQALAIILADGKQHHQTKIMRIRETLWLVTALERMSGLTFM